ncbi:MAG: HEAT repeat domain-containing protein, partial [Burkholderiales bacterium]
SVSALAEALRQSGAAEPRRNAIWALTRIEGEQARAAVRGVLNDGEESVRQAAIHSASAWRDAAALPQLLDTLKSGSPQLQRAAAEALGRIGDKSAVAQLLAVAGAQHDRVLEHSLIYALIEIADPTGTVHGFAAATPQAKRAALIALDQMDGGDLRPEMVTPLLVSSEPLLKQTAWWIAGHHPEWGPKLAGFFHRRLADPNLSPAEREELQGQLAQFGRNEAIQELLAATAGGAVSKESRVTALGAMARVGLKKTSPAWLAALVRVLGEKDDQLVRHAVAAARALPASKEGAPDLSAALLGVARDATAPREIRLDALAAIPGGLASPDPELFDFLCASIEPAQQPAVRSAAAGVLAKAKLSREQLLALTDSLKSAGPMELTQLLPAFDNGSDEALGLKLVAALKDSKGRSNLRADLVKARLAKYPESVRKQGEELLVSLDMD